MIKELYFTEASQIAGGVDCNCLDVSHNVVQTQEKIKNKDDCWKFCCKDSGGYAPGGVLQVYIKYSDFEGMCMVDKGYLSFLQSNKKQQNNSSGL